MLAETRNVGLRALIRAAGLDGKPLTAGRIGFILAPRLNAAGRLGHALRGVELLMTEDEHEANAIARELEELNDKRQEIDRATLEQARERVLQLDLDEVFGIVLADEAWHPGVIGIVASRLVEEFGRPTILIALEGDQGKGSGRSISKFDLHGALGQSSEYPAALRRAPHGGRRDHCARSGRGVRGAVQRSRPIAAHARRPGAGAARRSRGEHRRHGPEDRVAAPPLRAVRDRQSGAGPARAKRRSSQSRRKPSVRTG